MRKIILASQSPRRSSLLVNLGLQFEVFLPEINENLNAETSPRLLAQRLARKKAEAVRKLVESGVIIAADTIVLLGDEVLGKPGSSAEAIDMLSKLSGKRHQVITGVCVIDKDNGYMLLESETTEVWFRTLSIPEINAYVKTGEPFDKAGGYGIQGKGSILIEKIEGCYYNVVGLPLTRLHQMLRQVGVDILAVE